jgi:hypothetical protein
MQYAGLRTKFSEARIYYAGVRVQFSEANMVCSIRVSQDVVNRSEDIIMRHKAVHRSENKIGV